MIPIQIPFETHRNSITVFSDAQRKDVTLTAQFWSSDYEDLQCLYILYIQQSCVINDVSCCLNRALCSSRFFLSICDATIRLVLWQVDWGSHLWRTKSSWDVSHSSSTVQHSLHQIRPTGSLPRSSIMLECPEAQVLSVAGPVENWVFILHRHFERQEQNSWAMYLVLSEPQEKAL